MKEEIEKLSHELKNLSGRASKNVEPIAELDLDVNPKEAYLYANREGFLKLASLCLEMASEEIDMDGAHIHLLIEQLFRDSKKELVLELRNDWT